MWRLPKRHLLKHQTVVLFQSLNEGVFFPCLASRHVLGLLCLLNFHTCTFLLLAFPVWSVPPAFCSHLVVALILHRFMSSV